MIRRTWRAAVVVLSVVLVASCTQLLQRDSPRHYWSTHTIGELCRYPLDFFTNDLRRPGLEVVSPTPEPEQTIDGYGACVLDANTDLTWFHVSASLETGRTRPPQDPTADYTEREAIQVGADTVRVWSRDDGMGRDLRVDLDRWTGRLVVHLNRIGEPTGETALPDEHLPAAAEMLVRMTRDLKGPS